MATQGYSANFNQGELSSAVFVIDLAGMTALTNAIAALPATHPALQELRAIEAYMTASQALNTPVPAISAKAVTGGA